MKTVHYISLLFICQVLSFWAAAQGGGNNGNGGNPSDTTAADSLAETQVYWEDLQNVSYSEQTGMLTKTGADGWMNSGAVGKNVFEAGKDGFISYKIPALQREYTLGLSTIQPVENHRNADYAFLVEDKSLSIIESGTIVKQVSGNLKATDELKIERKGGEIRYLKNDQLLKVTPTNPSFELRPQVGLNKKGEIVVVIRTRTAVQPRMRVEVTDANCITGTLGSLLIIIDLDPVKHRIQNFRVQNLKTGQFYHFLIFISPHIEISVPDLFPADYQVTMVISQESTVRTLQKTVTVQASTVDVQSQQGLKEKSGGDLVKEKPDGWGNAGFETRPIISPGQDGKFSYKVAAFDGEMAVGMGSVSHNNHFNAMEYGFFISEQGLSIMESGQLKSFTSNLTEGDMLTMERQSGMIRYKKNDLVLKETVTDPTKELKVQAALYKEQSIARPILVESCFDTPDPSIQYFAIRNGNWTDPTTWSTESHTSTVNKGTYPGPSDWVSIKDHSLTVNSEVSADVILANDPKSFNTQISIGNGGKLTTRLLSFFSGIAAVEGEGSGGDKSLKLLLQGGGRLEVTERLIFFKGAGVGTVLMSAADQSTINTGKLFMSYAGGTKGVEVALTGTSELSANEMRLDAQIITNKKVSVTTSDNAKIKANGNIIFDGYPGTTEINLNGNSTLEMGGNFIRSGNSGSLNMDLAGNTTIIYNGTGDQILAADQLPGTTDKFIYKNITLSKPSGSIALEGDATVNGTLYLSKTSLSLLEHSLDILPSRVNAVDAGEGYIILDGNGAFKRNIMAKEDYMFPLSLSNADLLNLKIQPGTELLQQFSISSNGPDAIAIKTERTNDGNSDNFLVHLQKNQETEIRLVVERNSTAVITGVNVFNPTEGQYRPLPAGLYSVSGTNVISFTSLGDLGDYVRAFSACTADDARNWTLTKTYDEQGNLSGMSKSYSDFLGRPIQVQTKNLTANQVLASQIIYDKHGRPVATSLSAPVDQTDFCFKEHFITDNITGNDYTYNYFDLPSTPANASGEIYNPRTVGAANPGTLGWYYSNSNTLEPYVPASGFPYYRVEYDDNNMGRIKQSSMAGEVHRMGAGHETESYMMKASTELFYVFGFTEGWGIAADNSNIDIALGGTVENINPVLNLDYQAWKTIKIDRNGNEKVIFTDISGNVIATCSSGKLNDANVKTVNVNSPILTGSSGYVDIHLPDGCESSLYLQNGVVFNILNLRTNQFVKFSGYSESSSGTEDITGSSDNFFTLTPGIYRVIDKYKTSDNNSARNVHYQLNYYDFTLYYYDKANRLIKIVPPEGTDPAYNLDIEITNRHGCKNFYANSAFTPKWSLSSSAHQPGFYFNLPQAASSTSQFTNLYFYLDDDGTTSCTTGGEEGGDGGAQFRTAQTLAGRTIAEGSALLRQSGEGSGIGGSDALFKAPGDDVELFTESNEDCDCPPPTGISHCMDPQCGGFDDAGAASQWADFYCSKQYCGDAPWGYTGYATRHWGDVDGPFCIYCDQKRPGPGWIARYEIYYDVYTVTAFNTNPLPPPDVAANRSFFADRYADGTWQFSSPEDLGTAVVDYLQSFTSNQVILVVSDVKEFTVTINTTTGQGTIPQTYDYTYLSEIRLNIDARTFDVSTDEPAHLMASTFQYNTLGWLLTSERPDEGKSEFVYRNDGQLRFSQDARQANENKFSYFNYDRSARVVESGVFASSSVNNLYFQNHKLSLTLPSGANSVIPIIGNLSSNDGLADTYCSQQTFLLYDVPDANFPTTPSYLSNYKQTFLHGKISKTWNANPATSATWYSYDEQGASRWMAQEVAGLGIKTMDYAYSSKGLLDRTDFQKYVNAEKFAHRFTYDADQRLTKAETSSNDGTSWLEQAEYSYYLHGPLKRIELANEVQGIDYTYTINGWLKAINHPGSLDAGTGGKGSECNNNNLDPGQDGFSSGVHSGFAKDVFGMALDYHWLDYNRSNTGFDYGIDTDADQFNGNIKSMRWKTLRPFEQPAQEQQMYSFNYDKRNWLTEATFGSFVPCVVTSYTPDGEPAQIGPPTKTPTDDYKLWGLSYDRNGNILSMNRNALEVPPQADVPGSTLTTRNMDGMTYNYMLTGGRRVDNKLNFITDAGDNAKPNAWQDIKNQNADNYVYDNAGQMIYDASEDNFYEYDASGLVTGIYKKQAGSSPPQKDAAKPKVKFYYDEVGLRIKKEAFHKFTFALTKETWYVNNAIYEKDAGGAATPQLEELGVFGLGRIGIYNKPGNSYLYELTDHLGSVRATIGRQKNTDGAAQLMSSSDQYPWGMPMPAKTFNTYRFDYQGAFAEKDAETGFNNFELRQWDGRKGRWDTRDAWMQYHSPYLGMGNNPVRLIDPDGGEDLPCEFLSGGSGSYAAIGWAGLGVTILANSLQGSSAASADIQARLANRSFSFSGFGQFQIQTTYEYKWVKGERVTLLQGEEKTLYNYGNIKLQRIRVNEKGFSNSSALNVTVNGKSFDDFLLKEGINGKPMSREEIDNTYGAGDMNFFSTEDMGIKAGDFVELKAINVTDALKKGVVKFTPYYQRKVPKRRLRYQPSFN